MESSPTSPRRLLHVAELEDGTPPRPSKAQASPARGLLAVTSIEEDSPAARVKDTHMSVSAQLQSLEATLEQLLSQTASGMRKDMTTREERINRRLETERKEHQTALFDFRRDLALQQTADLAAHEERLAHRMDDERRENKAALAELRQELNAQEDALGQLGGLRKDVATLQATLSKLPKSLAAESQSQDAASNKHWEQATAAVEAAVADLRREMVSQREQLRLQATANESRLASLRKEMVTMHSSESNTLTEQMHRHTSDLARSVQEVSGAVETMGCGVRAELRREVERLATELQLERTQAEQRAGEARGSAYAQRLEALETSIQEFRKAPLTTGEANNEASAAALEARVEAIEASCRSIADITAKPESPRPQDSVEELDTLRVALDKTQAVAAGAQREVERLAKELAEQQQHLQVVESKAPVPAQTSGCPLTNEQIQQLTAVMLKEATRLDQKVSEELLQQLRTVDGGLQGGLTSCRAALEESSRSIGRLTQDLSRERSERCAALADLSCRVEDAAHAAERAERKSSEEFSSRGAPSLEVGDSASNVTGSTLKAVAGNIIGSAEHVALAACVGELDAELRMEISEHMQQVVAELRNEIAERVSAVEVEFSRFRGGSGSLTQVESRLGKLESARLDLRIGALESAWQRASSWVVTGRQAEVGETRELDDVGSATLENSCNDEAMRKIQHLRDMLHVQAQRLSTTEMGLLEQSPDSPQRAQLSLQLPGESVPQLGRYAGGLTPREQVASEAADLPMSETSTLHAGFDMEDMREEVPRSQDDASFEPLISDDLKERLEVLVKQVKKTLDRTEPFGIPEVPVVPGESPAYTCLANSLSSSMLAVDTDAVPAMDMPCTYTAVERRVSRVTVGPPVLKSVSISAPRRAPSPTRTGSAVVPAVATTTRIRSPSPVRRLVVSPMQPVPLRSDIGGTPLGAGGSWVGGTSTAR